MKFLSLQIIFLLFITSSFSQFSTKTEYEYLKLINFQQNKKLIQSSIPNVDIVANNIILEKQSKLNSLFYSELSNSYYISKNYNTSLYYQIIQRVMFFNDSISNKTRFYDSGFKANLSKKEIDFFWNSTSKNKLPKLKNDKILYSLKLTTKLYAKENTSKIYNLGLILRKQNYIIPQWYKDWEYITTIGIKEKHKEKLLNYDSKTELFKRLNSDNRIYIYSKAINYYTKKHAFKQAENLKVKYKKEKLSIWKKSDLFIKSIVTFYHKII
ncbi:MAG TPA: hypothetical protein EYP87_00035 [Flavobacteriaceae bacterium]|nr:hypothetical protein [Flavobacteriaceae bacterium]